MDADWLAYMKQMHDYLQKQNETLRNIDSQLQQLREEWARFLQQSGKPVKHEYRFDLLKVEQLQGNLHIGVKPDGNGGNWIEQLAVEGDTSDAGRLNPEMAQAYDAIRREIRAFFANVAEQSLKAFEQKWSVSLDEDHRRLVLQDVESQIDGRIRHYLRRIDGQEAENEEALMQIADRVKQDIAATFETFIRNYGSGEQGGAGSTWS